MCLVGVITYKYENEIKISENVEFWFILKTSFMVAQSSLLITSKLCKITADILFKNSAEPSSKKVLNPSA